MVIVRSGPHASTSSHAYRLATGTGIIRQFWCIGPLPDSRLAKAEGRAVKFINTQH